MKALSIKQPWASLIAHGIKDIENRTWKTNYRGRILVHSTIRPVFNKTPLELLTKEQLEEVHQKHGYFFPWWEPKGAIIGEVDIVDCVINHSSIWAEKSAEFVKSHVGIISSKPIYKWVLANPLLYVNPILNVKGKLSFWEFNKS